MLAIQKFSVADITLQGHSRSSKTIRTCQRTYYFLLTFNSNCSSVLDRFCDTAVYLLECEFSHTSRVC